jgi:putative transposase
VVISVVYLLVRCLLGCLTVLTRGQVSKDAELLVLRHENAPLAICAVQSARRLSWISG